MPKIGVVLSGCGVYDGTEIHEAVLTMLALDEAGAQMVLMAPRGPQMHVVDHLTGEPVEGTRDVLVESARIARGEITDIAEVRAEDLDALVFPGGFGAAKNLCDFAVKGAECITHEAVAALVRQMHAQKKPIGFACIAPALAAAIFRDVGVAGINLTIGDDEGTASAIDAMGSAHVKCAVEKTVVDLENRIVSTPAYMLAGRISEVRASTKAMVDEVLALI